jgi:hypothetical protein
VKGEGRDGWTLVSYKGKWNKREGEAGRMGTAHSKRMGKQQVKGEGRDGWALR